MTRLYIPQVGDKLTLKENWDCKIFNEYRNAKIFAGLHIEPEAGVNVDVTFPKGTVFKVGRLYVRAPASSFDSITLSVETCPIKSLQKARFWVKLMEANKMQCEDTSISIESYDKIKDVFRFVALENDFPNSERLSDKNKSFVAKILYDHFKEKNNEVIIKMTAGVAEILRTVEFAERFYFYTANPQNQYQERLTQAKELFQETQLVLHLLPALNGFVYYYEPNADAIALDKHFDLYQKESNDNWSERQLGSKYSQEIYQVSEDKNLLSDLQPGFEVYYQEQRVDIKDVTALYKFIKKIRG